MKAKANFIPKKDVLATEELQIKLNGSVWATVLDKRFCCEVVRKEPYLGQLLIFDSENDMQHIFTEEVFLAFDALFGPDWTDVGSWKNKVVDYVDNHIGGN